MLQLVSGMVIGCTTGTLYYFYSSGDVFKTETVRIEWLRSGRRHHLVSHQQAEISRPVIWAVAVPFQSVNLFSRAWHYVRPSRGFRYECTLRIVP